MIGSDLRTWLLETVGLGEIVGEKVHQNMVPEETEAPYVWFARAGRLNDDAFDDAVGTAPFRQLFDVELFGSIEEVDGDGGMAELLAAQHLYRGSLGTGRVQAVFISDHEDDYVPRGYGADSGLYYAAMRVEIVGYEEA